MRPTLELLLQYDDRQDAKSIQINRVIIAGWTARDEAAIQEHIEELAELGVAPPSRTPLFYRVAARRLTTDAYIEAIGEASSGEAEFFLLNIDGDVWVGAGSDHTDRAAEAQGITLSKQMCDKPVARPVWRLADVKAHWDRLRLSSWIVEGGERLAYQDGQVAAILSPDDLMGKFAVEDEDGGLGPGDLMMCGTLPAIGGVRSSAHFAFSLTDPVLDRRIAHAYDIVTLPDAG